MQNLILVIMLLAIGVSLPIDVSAKIDPATLARQRAANQARLSKSLKIKRMFNKAESHDPRTLKLDAIPPSPRRGAKTSASKAEPALPGNPRRATSASKSEHLTKPAATPDE